MEVFRVGSDPILSTDVLGWIDRQQQRVVYTRGNSLGKLFTSSYRNRLHGKSISRASGSWTTRNERLNPLTFSCSPAFEIGTHHRLSIVLTSCLLRYNCVTTLIKVTSYEIRVRQTLSFAFIQLEILGKNAVRHSFGKLHRKTNLLIGCFVEFFNSNVFLPAMCMECN